MTQENPVSTTKKSSETVCPESTIESATRRDFIRKAVPRKDTKDGNNKSNFVCESTIDSSLRRDFIKKAAILTAAAGIGGALLGSEGILPKSSARSSTGPLYGCCPCGNAGSGYTCT